MPQVFVSYTHDDDNHKARILALADRMRAGAINCLIDQYVEDPPRGWPNWCLDQLQSADFVLVVCTEIYLRRFQGKETMRRGNGGVWEGFVITQQLYDAHLTNDKFIPVVVTSAQTEFIPVFLRGFTFYDLSRDVEYESLYRRLTKQPYVTIPPLGARIDLPKRQVEGSRISRDPVFREKGQFHSNLPFARNHFFTGRDALLERIGHLLHTSSAAAISGLAGQGKTQIAVEYAFRNKDEYSSILWARADSRDALVSSFAELAHTLSLPEASTAEQKIAVAAVKAWLESNERWLLILDNADEIDVVRDFLPRIRNSHILLTTRASATGAVAERVTVEDMGVDEGALFLLRRINRLARDGRLMDANHTDKEAAKAISTELGGLPLALDQAGAFIEETYYSPDEYLQLYRHEGAKLRANAPRSLDEHPAISVTFSIAFQKVSQANDASAKLVQLSAFLAPSPIPEEIFAEAGSEISEQFSAYSSKAFEFSQIIKHAVRLSLMQRDPVSTTLHIHRLVQAVLRDGMSETEIREWSERTVRLISRVVNNLTIDQASRFERLLPHIQACADWISKFTLNFDEAAEMLARTSRYLFWRVRIAESENLCSQALNIRETLLGSFHPKVAELLNDLGLINDFECRFSKAEELFQRALAIHAKSTSRDELAVATVRNNLGNCYYVQSRYHEAESELSKALSIRERLLRPDHRDRATSLNDLARLLEAKGDYAQAKTLYQNSLDMREKLFGPDHQDVAISLSNLANLYSLQSLENQAFPLYQRAFEIRVKALGRNHPDVATSLNSLANYYYQRYDDQKAEELYREAIDIWERKLGKNHPATATGLSNLGSLFSSKGRDVEAEQLFRRALEICEKTLGPSSLKTARTLEELANHLFARARWSEAEPLYVKIRNIRETSLGPKHRLVAASINNLAGVSYARGEYAQAEVLYQESLVLKEETLGKEHLDVAFTLNNLAGACSAQGMHEKAEYLHRRALPIWERHRGPDHPYVAMSLNNLAACLADQSKFEEAEGFALRALAIRREKLGKDHADVFSSLNSLAIIEAGLHKDREAEEKLLMVLDQRQNRLHDATATAGTQQDLATFYLARQRYDEAEPLFESALSIRDRDLGREHIQTGATLLSLAQLSAALNRLDRAETLFRESMMIFQRRLEDKHPYIVECRQGLEALLARRAGSPNAS